MSLVHVSLLLAPHREAAEEHSDVNIAVLLVTQQPHCLGPSICMDRAPQPTANEDESARKCKFNAFNFIFCLFSPNDPLVSYAAQNEKKVEC